MNRASLLFTKPGEGAASDDRLSISAMDESRDMFMVAYETPDHKYTKTFVASRSTVLQYVEDTLKTMRHDVHPFENIQVNSCIHPAVLYHVSDMDDCDIRDLILNTICDSLRFDICNVPR